MTTTTEAVTALRENYETIIRDQAGLVANLVRSRNDHPSYGTTKTQVRDALQRMNGSIGTYMVLFGQAGHPGIWSLATFVNDATTESVQRAVRAEASL